MKAVIQFIHSLDISEVDKFIYLKVMGFINGKYANRGVLGMDNSKLKEFVKDLNINIEKLEITAEKIYASKSLADFYNSILKEVLLKLNTKGYITREEFMYIFQENFKEHNVEESISIIKNE